MAKTIAEVKKQNKINLENLSERDRDILTLDVPASMKKYKLGKQAVYDRRFALNKKIKAAGLTVEQVLNDPHTITLQATKAEPKTAQAKKTGAKKIERPVEEKLSDTSEVIDFDKQIPMIMKPIEIKFDNFSIKLNGVPKKVSVNSDINAIEIDL
ncbi:MAG: hypothetical protein JWQ09_2860 [Segetibacter sp.]|nr:hypothetical protein [Segetibacter sp.]